MELNEITLRRLLPVVFRGEDTVKGSDIWLADEVRFTRGSTYMVAASSGGGKSSLCSFIYGNRSDYDGRILFDGTDIAGYGVDNWCRARRELISLLPQEMRIFGELSAMENVMLKNRLTDYHSQAEITAMFARLEIDDKVNSPACRLSVGQQQRVAIIRSLCQPFSFIFLDEPVSHLDERNNRAAAALISEEAAARGAAIVATSVGNPLALRDYALLKM